MKKTFLDNASQEEKDRYQKFGEKFYNQFNVDTGKPNCMDPTICMEESLAYVVESLKSGLHPKHLTFDEATLLKAGYGDKWFEKWGYQEKEIPEEFLKG
jgi:hypothetical protein